MFIINNERLQVLFTYTYLMSRNISTAEGGRIGAGSGEIPEVYIEAKNALVENKKISDVLESSEYLDEFFNELIVPIITEQIEPESNKEDYVKAALLQYSADLAHYFKQTDHFVKRNVSLEFSKPYREYLDVLFNGMFSDIRPFDEPETEKLFRTKLDMDIEDFYHNAALTMQGAPLLVSTNLMESTYNQMKTAIEEYEQARGINYDGLFVSIDDKPKKLK